MMSTMKKSNHAALRWTLCLLFAGFANAADTPEKQIVETPKELARAENPKKQIKVDDNSFKCITEMTPVKHFFVDNLLGKLDATVAVAKAGNGVYPVGSVLQLMPNEVMVKHEKGYNPATRDWEFFWIDNTKEGSKIFTRGFADVNNRLGLNCFTCHTKAQEQFDFVCETENGCDPIPVTRAMFGALARTDPRCKGSETVSAEDQELLKQLGEIVKTLSAKPSDASTDGANAEKAKTDK